MKRWIPVLPALLLIAAAGAQSEPSGSSEETVPDSRIGLVAGSVFEIPAPPLIADNSSDPGDRPTVEPLHAQAPPAIPHGIADFLPITRDENLCVDCHLVDEKVAGEPTPLPASHFVDLRNAPESRGETLVGARWVCVSCHVSLTAAAPLVGNAFRPTRAPAAAVEVD